jgi:hypothetical protein
MAPPMTETDWERFDGFTPTFTHPSLTHSQIQFLLGTGYTRFMRPAFLANFLRIRAPHVRRFVSALDAGVVRLQSRLEFATMERSL